MFAIVLPDPFVKNIIAHTGYYACERCEQKGYDYQHRRILPSVTTNKRDDNAFCEKRNAGHHTGNSPLEQILPTINKIFSFPLDFMHLCCLGVMKKLIECWLTTSAGTIMSRANIMQLTLRITNLTGQIPVEFQRQLLQSLGLIS